MANSLKVRKYFFIYKTTNIINGKYYIGMHSTSNLKDGYLGSGKKLRYSIRKYGVENFKCEILEFLPDRISLAAREKELVNEELLNDVNCLNLKPGGLGGISNEIHYKNFVEAGRNNLKKTLGSRQRHLKWLRENDEEWNKKHSSNISKALKGKPGTWIGKTHSECTKSLMRQSKKGKGVGNKNSQYGSFWITNGEENKKVNQESIIPEGWYKGRTVPSLSWY